MWIAFRIVFLLMIPNNDWSDDKLRRVVNCFQNCIFTYDSQLSICLFVIVFSCELLSELYFYLWFPTGTRAKPQQRRLWIAFRIVFLLMIPNVAVSMEIKALVVNCFQNCIFTYDSQRYRVSDNLRSSCELLSELYFYLWFPTKVSNTNFLV